MLNRIVSEFSPGRNDNLYKYTKGGEFSLNGKEYIGEYHIIGEVPKTGPTPSKESKVLRKIYVEQNAYEYDRLFDFKVPVSFFVEPIPYIYRPQEQAYITGYDYRYFVEKLEDDLSFAIEIDQDQFNSINKRGGIDGGLYLSAQLNWKLTGFREDIINHNSREILHASIFIPSIQYAIKNFWESATITLF